MNYERINELGKEYKTNKRVIVELISLYDPIMCKLMRNIPFHEKDEVQGIFNLQLIKALNSYNPKICAFNTYAYYYIIATPRIYHTLNTYCKNKFDKKDNSILEECYQDDTHLIDFNIDLPKILTDHERLLYRAYVNNQIKRWSPRLDELLIKIINYIRKD